MKLATGSIILHVLLTRFLVILIAVSAIGSAALMARVGLGAGVSPIGLSAWRLTVAAACLLIFQIGRPQTSREATKTSGLERWWAALAGLFLALHFATWIGSLTYVSVARSTLLVSSAPLWAGLFGLFVPRLRPKPLFWIGLVLACAGTWAVTSQGVPWHDSSRAWIGDLLALAGAICLVPYLLISQRLQTSIGWLATISWIYTVAALFLWVAAFASGTASIPTGPTAWGAILGMGLIAQLVGHSALNWSLNHFTAGQVAMSTLLEPVFAAALAWAILGERITFGQGAGGALLLAGVGVALAGKEPSARFG